MSCYKQNWGDQSGGGLNHLILASWLNLTVSAVDDKVDRKPMIRQCESLLEFTQQLLHSLIPAQWPRKMLASGRESFGLEQTAVSNGKCMAWLGSCSHISRRPVVFYLTVLR